jgi:hypothetical protein
VRIRNILYSVAVASLLGGCANQALAEEHPVSAAAPEVSSPAPPAGWVEPTSYKFTLTSSCGERDLRGTFQSKVKDGMVVESAGLDASARKALMLRLSRLVPTLGQLEAQAQTARVAGTGDVVIKTDPADGHPTSITIGTDECYQISDYSVG